MTDRTTADRDDERQTATASEGQTTGSDSERQRTRSEAGTRERTGDDPVPRDERLGGGVQTGRPEPLDTPEGIDWRGWLLVAVVVLSFVVIPLFVLYIPEMHWLIASLGFSRRQAYILFPMLPAILLGLTAVWATVRAHSK